MFSILGSNFCTPKAVLLSFEKIFILAFDTNSVDLPQIALFCPLYLFYTYLGMYILLKFAFIFRVPLKMSFFKYFVLGGIEMRTNEWNLLNYDLWVIQNAFAFCVVGSIFEVYNTTSNSIKNKLPKTRLRQLLGSAFIFCLSVCAICLLICQIYHNLL